MALLAVIKDFSPGSPMAFSILALVITMPVILFGPFVGVFVDRWNRKYILVVVDFLRTFLVFAIPYFLFLTHSIIPVYGIVFLVFFLGLFFNSTKMAIIPSLVSSHKEILVANAAVSFVGRFATVIGLVLGGVIVDHPIWDKFGWKGWQACFYFDAFTYFVSACLLACINLPRQDIRFSRLSFRFSTLGVVLRDTIAAIRFIRGQTILIFVFSSAIMVVFFSAVMYIPLLMLLQQVLNFGTHGVGYIGGIIGVGLMTGAFIFGTFGTPWSRTRIILINFVFLFILTALAGISHSGIHFAILGFLGGLFLSSILIALDTLLHENVPSAIRGRVFASKEWLWNTSFLLFSFLIGTSSRALAGGLGLDFALRTVIFLSAIIIFLSVLWNRAILRR